MPQVSWIPGPRDEVVDFTSIADLALAIEALPSLDADKHRSKGLKAGSFGTEQKRPQICGLPKHDQVLAADEIQPRAFYQISKNAMVFSKAEGNARSELNNAATSDLRIEEVINGRTDTLQLPEWHVANDS
jgi:hypothetical protein